MSMTDPIADMLTRIRNAQMANKSQVSMPASNLKAAVAKVLREEGYIGEYHFNDLGNNRKEMVVTLRYYEGKPVIELIQRVSTPGRRIFKGAKDLPKVRGGLGIAIISTSQGVMSDKNARHHNFGGEVLCVVA